MLLPWRILVFGSLIEKAQLYLIKGHNNLHFHQQSIIKCTLYWLLNNPLPIKTDLHNFYVVSPHMYVLKSVLGLVCSVHLSSCVLKFYITFSKSFSFFDVGLGLGLDEGLGIK